jgi:hypothetical protein
VWGKFLSLFLNWLVRGLTVVGGLVAILVGWPITEAAWQTQRVDATLYALRTAKQVGSPEAAGGDEALSRAIALDPTSTRYLLRSELLGSSALTPSVGFDAAQRTAWLRRARADLIAGLSASPAHGVDWLRLAALQLELEGPSRVVIALMFTSIEMAGGIPQTWMPRLRVILDCWPYLSDREKERLRRYVVMTWRHSVLLRDPFAVAVRSAADHAILTWFLKDEPGAPEELARLIEKVNKK